MHTDTNVTCMLLCGVFTVPSNGQQWSFDDCLEIRRKNKQELFCAVLYTTVVYNDVHTHMRTATIRYGIFMGAQNLTVGPSQSSASCAWHQKRKIRKTKNNKKLSYRRGTARYVTLVNSCYISRSIVGVRKFSNGKSDLQGNSKAIAMLAIDRPHTISLLLPLCLYLHHFRDIVIISQNLKRSRDTEHIPFGNDRPISCMHSYSSVLISTRHLKCLVSPVTKI